MDLGDWLLLYDPDVSGHSSDGVSGVSNAGTRAAAAATGECSPLLTRRRAVRVAGLVVLGLLLRALQSRDVPVGVPPRGTSAGLSAPGTVAAARALTRAGKWLGCGALLLRSPPPPPCAHACRVVAVRV